MKGFLRFLGRTFAVLLLLGGLAITADVYKEEIQYAWEKHTFEVPTDIAGIYPGMSKSDMIFKFGLGEAEADDSSCIGCGEWKFFYELEGGRIIVAFLDEERTKVSHVIGFDELDADHPLYHTEGLLEVLGEPEVLAIKSDGTARSYFYTKDNVVFKYSTNMLVTVTIGGMSWGASDGNDAHEYYVNGKQYCPGGGCPWGEGGELKSEFEGKSYRDLK